jgi:hypothetical protein
VAKAGSAAAGKMDMLSVLLYKYGHALGGSGIALTSFMRPNRYGGMNLDLTRAIAPQHADTANSTFVSLELANTWQTKGIVDITQVSIDT